MSNNQIPREDGIDHTLPLLKEGYEFILNRKRSFNSNIFETRIMGKKSLCMSGRDAAQVFYDTHLFHREGAAPNRLVQTLFGENGVQSLDGQAHRHRKEMHMSIMNEKNIKKFQELAIQYWEKALDHWTKKEDIVLYDEVKELLCKVACTWAGVLVEEEEIKWLTKELSEMFEGAGAIGPNHWKGRNAQNNVEKWMGELVGKIREGKLIPPEDTALYQYTWYKDLDGNLLDPSIVVVELLNVYRPMVAIAVYINFVALALIEHPDEIEKLKNADEKYTYMFIDEVRRYYPFFPFIAAKVKEDFTWRDYKIEKGTLAYLDIYGTNHDENLWLYPQEFNPNRFADQGNDRFSFIPQGGGEYLTGHRCAGEQLTIEMMKVSLDYLVNHMDYEVPEQDLTFEMNEFPSIPRSRVILRNVERKLTH
ncbi:cytochrome P450 [Ureibacillus manganicus]|uniref:Cytochrome P450 n=1 Tax=Ureibacillus manganicus DSM 26584 TaxID=1384049 RepID=A0A0A3I3E2_9BACL|nr:cytochrome P450 [Ureibacillus manganicus]KGR79244.1 cytochrome P450 [Ureibacillus manganicus DSM 26584]